MPVIPSSAYVSLETVTNLVRSISNDTIYSLAGEILTDTANFMFSLLNDSLEWFQNEVNNHGIETFVKETYLLGITPAAFVNLDSGIPAPNDPGQQVNISDLGYFDGALSHVSPQLPTDLLVPLVLWERQFGSTENWVVMVQRQGGLPSTVPGSRFRIWEWRQDGLYMPGATQENDIRLRYTGSHATFVTPNDALYFRGATGAIAYKTVATYMGSKNPQAATQAMSEAMSRVIQLCSRSARMKQREYIDRRNYGNPRGGRVFVPPHNP